MEKTIHFEPGWDRRDPSPSKNYGIGGMKIRFVLRGASGAVQFLLGTRWYPENVQIERHNKQESYFELQPMAWDLGYHSLAQMYEEQSCFPNCECLDGATCYYDGSTLFAEPIAKSFLIEGDKAVWDALESYYCETFGDDTAEEIPL